MRVRPLASAPGDRGKGPMSLKERDVSLSRRENVKLRLKS